MVMPAIGIADLTVSVPDGFYPMRLDEDIDSEVWAQEVVTHAEAESGAVDHEDALRDELFDLRIRLLAQLNPYLTAAVYVRREQFLSLGALMTFQVVEVEPEHDPAWFEREARAIASSEDAEGHTILFDTWQHPAPAGTVAGVHQVVEYLAPGVEDGWIEARTVFGVFPPGSHEMVHFTFTTADLATFGDMPAETESIVASLSIELEA
jgi:hypothetical protein